MENTTNRFTISSGKEAILLSTWFSVWRVPVTFQIWVNHSSRRDFNQSAQLKLIGEFFESGKASDRMAKPRPLTMEDFRQILEERKPSVSLDMLALYNRWFEAFKAL
jgi:hypothetical protein